jgi:putative sterol carrier protein
VIELGGAREYDDANAAFADMLTGPREPALEEPAHVAKAQPDRVVTSRTVQAVFESLAQEHFQPQAAAGIEVVLQFSISGPAGGDWAVVVKGGECTVEPGVHKAPTTTLLMSDEDFLRYVAGKLPAMQAYSTGKLKIQGDLMKSQLVEKLFRF